MLRVQRVVRQRQAHTCGDGHGAAGFRSGSGGIRKLRSLKKWVPVAVKRWKSRRQEGATLVHSFLRDARLTQNIKAIYRFRKKVIRYVLLFSNHSLIGKLLAVKFRFVYLILLLLLLLMLHKYHVWLVGWGDW